LAECSHAFASEIIHLFYIVFSVVRAVHKFEFRLVINVTSYKQAAVERKFCSNRG
jgi:hypothetical protein